MEDGGRGNDARARSSQVILLPSLQSEPTDDGNDEVEFLDLVWLSRGERRWDFIVENGLMYTFGANPGRWR